MTQWRFFENEEPEWGKHIYFLVEHEGWYDGPLLASYIIAGVRLEDGRYVCVRHSDNHEIVEDVTMVAWRYVPDDLTHPGFEREMASALAKYSGTQP